MKHRRLQTFCLGGLAVLACSFQLLAATVSLDKVPVVVQKAIKEQLKGGTLGEIDQTTDDGTVTFEVAAKKGETEWSFTLAADGTLLELEIPLSEAPAPVQKTIKTAIGKGTIDLVTKSFDENEVTYDVEFTTTDGKDRFLSVDADGTLNTLEIGLEEAPKAIREKITEVAGKWKVEMVAKSYEEGKVFYDVDLSLKDKERDFRLTESGKLETEQVFIEDVTPEARKTILGKLGEGKVVRIDKAYENDGSFVFEIEGLKNGQSFDFSVGPKGRMRSKVEIGQ